MRFKLRNGSIDNRVMGAAVLNDRIGSRNIFAEKNLMIILLRRYLTTLVITVMSGLSQLERDLISQRTKEGLTSAKARGRNGGRPSKQNEKAEMVMALYDSGMKHNTRGVDISTSFLCVMNFN